VRETSHANNVTLRMRLAVRSGARRPEDWKLRRESDVPRGASVSSSISFGRVAAAAQTGANKATRASCFLRRARSAVASKRSRRVQRYPRARPRRFAAVRPISAVVAGCRARRSCGSSDTRPRQPLSYAPQQSLVGFSARIVGRVLCTEKGSRGKSRRGRARVSPPTLGRGSAN
jgi:hypothetical protein